MLEFWLNKLLDIKKQTLEIASFTDNKINANINLKWKRFWILKFKDKPIFEVKDVSKSFDGRPILKNFLKSLSRMLAF